MQGELAAIADWGVVLRFVYIKFRLQINTPKSPQFCRPCVKGGGFSLEKPEGLTFIKQPVLQANLQANIIYKQNVLQSLSQLRWQLSLPKRALLFVRFEMLICNRTSAPNRAGFVENYNLTDFQSTLLSATPTPSLAQGGQICNLSVFIFYRGKSV